MFDRKQIVIVKVISYVMDERILNRSIKFLEILVFMVVFGLFHTKT